MKIPLLGICLNQASPYRLYNIKKMKEVIHGKTLITKKNKIFESFPNQFCY